ncbi:uncharacterized protein JCM10292_003271 [Rhodotorula paludigena]|uniref:uncharacterized protein n=1 Tax=Rhodotorula paludigena TaxID=86838 RepID=UPI00317AB8C9
MAAALVAPVTPIRSTSFFRETPPSLPAPPARTRNPRKRPLPDSPIGTAFPFCQPVSSSSSRPRLSLAQLGTTSSAPLLPPAAPSSSPIFPLSLPHAPLLPSLPIFERPAPFVVSPPISPVGPHSSPMKRSPAMRNLARFTADAYREAAARDLLEWERCPLEAIDEEARFGDAVEDDGAEDFPPFHLELSTPERVPAVRVDRLHTTDAAPFALLPDGWTATPSWSPALSCASCSTPELSSSASTASYLSSSSSSSSSSGFDSPSPSPSPSLPFSHLTLSPSSSTLTWPLSSFAHPSHHLDARTLPHFCAPVREPSSLAMRRMGSLDKRRREREREAEALVGLGLEL